MACCLILILVVSGCGYSTNVSAASVSTAAGSSDASSASAISFIQVASATPQSPTASVGVSYSAAQTAGDLNVVVVGWNDTTATVQSVKDSAGNPYSLAIGPTSGTALRQSIYYAPNIKGGSNTVTATFNQAATAPDVRILEYRGVTALDVTAGASGNSASASSGAATTRSANELIFGANTVATMTGAAGSGFTSRIVTSPDGDIAEDKVVTAAGSNSATATLAWAGPWVMQMVAFSTASVPGSPAAVPQLTVSPTSLNFGNVTVGSSSTLPLTLTSTGTAAVTINSGAISGTGFSVTGATSPLTLNPKQTVTLQVKSAPTTAGAVTGALTINSNSSTNPTTTVGLSSTGAAASTPQLTVSATSLSFGNVGVGSTSTLPVTVTSTGTAPLIISSAAIGGTGFTVSGASFPLTLNPKQATTLSVKFAPTAASASTGALTIASNASGHTSTAVSLSGTGTSTSTRLFTMSPTSLSFGNVAVGSSATQAVTLTSTGTSAVTINSASISGTGFTLSGVTFPVTLNPKQTATLSIKFAPTKAGAASGALSFSSNSSSNASGSVGLSGNGTSTGTATLTVSSTSLSFGNVSVGSSATLPVTLTSSGTSAVTVNSGSISGTGFTVSGATFPVTLNPKQAVTLQVKFAPTAASAVTGNLTVSSNSSTNATVAVSLSGTGTSHQVSLTWGAPGSSSDPVAGYHIYRATGTSSSYTLLNSSVVTLTSYVDRSVVSGTGYTYYVKSVDASGKESAASNSVSVTVPNP